MKFRDVDFDKNSSFFHEEISIFASVMIMIVNA